MTKAPATTSKHLRATKAQLVEEIERLECRLDAVESVRAHGNVNTDATAPVTPDLMYIFKEMPTGLCYFDTKFRFLVINDWLANLNGMTVDEHLGRTIGQVLPDVAEGVESQLRQVVQSGEPIIGGTVEAETPAQPGVKRTFQHNYYPVSSDDGTIAGVSCVVQDITERKTAEEALRRSRDELERRVEERTRELRWSEERFRAIVEDQTEFIGRSLPGSHTLTFVNEAYCRYYGKTSEELLGTSFMDHIPEEDRDMVDRQLAALSQENPIVTVEHRAVQPDGEVHWHDWTSRAIFDDAGEIVEIQAVGRDITERKQAEKALTESEAKFRDYAEASADWFWEMDANLRFTYMSENVERILGVAPEWHYGKTREDLLGGDYDRDVWQDHLKLLQEHKPFRNFEYLRTGDGVEPAWLRVSGIPLFAEDGAFLGYRGTGSDITKQRVAEKAQRESEQAAAEAQMLLLEAMESSSDGIAIYDSDDKLKLYNEVFRTGILSGFADLIEPGVRYEQLVRAAVARNLVSVPDGDVESYVRVRLEQHRRTDSSVEVALPNNRWMLARDRRLPGGGFVGTRSDITDLKRARLALKESRRQAADALAMLTEAMESNPDAVAIFDADDRLTHYNEAYRTGFSAELSKSIKPGARFQDILRAAMERNLYAIPDGDREAYFNDSLELHRQGGRSLEIELADGRWFLFSERRMPGGGTVSTRSDITERRRAELALRENDQRLRTMIENVPGVVWRHILHADGSVTFPFLSPHHVKWLGIDFDAAMKNTQVIFERLHPDDRDGWNAAWGKSAKSLTPFHREVRIFGSANDIRWFRVRALPQQAPNGDTQWDAVGIDVTDEKRAAEVRDRMFAALENLTDAIALFGPDDRLVYTNPRYIEYNEKAGSVVKPGNTFEQILRGNVQLGRFPEATGREEDWIAERLAARRNLPYAVERKVDGGWFDVREAALPDGSTVLLIIDITERKAAEAALLRNEASLAAAQRIAHLGSWELEVETGTATWSAESYRIFGYQPGAIDPSRDLVKAAVHPADRDAFVENFRRAYADSPYSYDIEYRIVRSDGSQRFIHSKAELQRNEAGKPIKLTGTVHDITERKRAEAEATEAHHRLSDAIESISEGFILYDADERFVLCNEKYREFYPKISDLLVPGTKVEDIVRATIERGQLADNNDGDAWFRMRLAQYRSAQGAHEQHLSDGRWLLATESRTTEGGFVGIRTDITERKRAEEAIKKNEQQLMLITENAPAMISYIGQDERYRFANSAYENLVGVSPRQLLGVSIRDFWGEAIYARVGDNVKRVLAGETVNFEHTLPAKAGGNIYLAVTYVPHIVDGSVEAFFTLATDITQLVTARQALREREQRIRNILENISDGVITIDVKGKIQSFNQAAERMFGFAEAEIMGKAVSRLMPTSDRKQHPGYIRNYLETGKGKIIGVGRREVIARRKDGSTFPISIGLSEMWTGEKRSFIGSLLDMTQQEAAKEALRTRDERLRQLQSELLRVNRAATIGQLSSSLTHELKQPLAAATFYMQAIQQLLKKDGTKSGKEIAEIIGKVGDQVGRAATVVGRLRPLLERGEVEREEVDINDVVEEAVAVAALELDRKNIDLKIILGRNLPRLPVDKIQVQQVLLNLVRNAVEATRESKRRELTVRTRATKDGEIEVSVSDSGHGIPAKIRSSIFDPFVTTRTGGTGMGLSVSRTIVEAHGGHIWASPRRGGGTIMHFNLALAERSFSDRRQT